MSRKVDVLSEIFNSIVEERGTVVSVDLNDCQYVC